VFGAHLRGVGIRSLAGVAAARVDVAIGVLALYSDERDFFHADEMKLLGDLTRDIAFAMDHIEKSERLNYLAFYDALTGLANRSLFLERVERLKHVEFKPGHKLAMILMDVRASEASTTVSAARAATRCCGTSPPSRGDRRRREPARGSGPTISRSSAERRFRLGRHGPDRARRRIADGKRHRVQGVAVASRALSASRSFPMTGLEAESAVQERRARREAREAFRERRGVLLGRGSVSDGDTRRVGAGVARRRRGGTTLASIISRAST
jgi:hypothetical protein